MDQFTQAYIECALWSSTDNSDETGGEPLDRNYSLSDIAPETLTKMTADCEAFQTANADHITDENMTHSGQYSSDEMAGRDFWLTRNGHGAGFWDGDWVEPVGKLLTDASKAYGSFDLYIGDDKQIHGQ